MSNNINDTKVDKIKRQVEQFIFDLNYYRSDNKMPPSDFFENKYSYLHSTSNVLFKFIYTNYSKPDFDKKSFHNNLDKMLDYIVKIQKGEISQYDASGIIGTHIAKQYIPQLKDK